MFTAEFEAKIENGRIMIPDEYRQAFERQENVKVILVKPDTPAISEDSKDLIQQLLNQPVAVEGLVPDSRDEFYDR